MNNLPFLGCTHIINYPAEYLLSEREGMTAHMQGIVFTIAGLKIVPTINNL